MNKIKYVTYTIMLFMVGIGVSYAASLGVNSSKKNVTVGSTFTVTVNASGAAGWEYCVAYDSSMLTLTKATSDTGGACVRTGSTLTGYSSVTYTFKANKSGTSIISLRDAVMYGDDGNVVSSTKGSVSIIAKTQQEIEASYSSNADLKNLVVDGYEIKPSFSKNELEYSLEVENDVEKVNIVATKDDNRSSVKGSGEVILSEGMNKIEIVVTAQKGNKKTYILNITRKELNPITVNVDGNSLNVVRKAENLDAPTYYSSTTIKIDDEDIPAFESEITGFVLVGLKDEDGNIKLYRYDNGKYTLYNQIAKDSFVFIPLYNDEIIEGFENKKTIRINDIDVESYSDSEEEKEIVLVYGMNASTGEKNWYKYDMKEGTFQRYAKEKNDLVKDEYFYLAIAFGGGLGLSILIIIILLIMNSSKEKKNKKLIAMIESKMSNNKKDVKVEDKKEEKEDKTDDELSETQAIEKLNNQFLDFIEDQSLNEERSDELLDIDSKDDDKEVLSKRELRKKEKEKKKAEEAELKAMQADFLETRENTLISDTDILEEIREQTENEEISTKKKTTKRKTKKSKK